MNDDSVHGVIPHPTVDGQNDYLFRISVKALVFNDKNEILLVREGGKEWDIPGGGIDHGESIENTLRRELEEEIHLKDHFTYKVVSVEDPTFVESHHFWLVRIIYAVWPDNLELFPGEDGDEIRFVPIDELKRSESPHERIYAENAERAIAK
jgi:ADP-ribose pyrophosphatase YjhB (NUDIX family)